MRNVTNADKVREFMVAMGQPVDRKIDPAELKNPSAELVDLVNLRWKLIREEVGELEDTDSLENGLKEIADLLYVTYGMAITFGFDIDTAFNRVHKSNMSKLGPDGKPVYREDGKVLKGPGYKPADLSDLV